MFWPRICSIAAIKRLDENGLRKYAIQPASNAAWRMVSLWFPVMNMTGSECPERASWRATFIPEVPLRSTSRTRQTASPRRAPPRRSSTVWKTVASKPCAFNTRLMASSVPLSSSRTIMCLLFVSLKYPDGFAQNARQPVVPNTSLVVPCFQRRFGGRARHQENPTSGLRSVLLPDGAYLIKIKTGGSDAR